MRMKGYVAYLIAFPTLSFFAYYLGIITRAADKRTNGCTFSPWTTDWDRDSGRRTPHGRQPTRTRFNAEQTPGQWRPDGTAVLKLLSYLNLTHQQASSMLPMTLQGPDVLGNDSLCVTEDGSPVDILFLVHTAVPHFSRRLNLRRTYMAPEYFWPYKLRTAFLLGQPANRVLQQRLELEQHQYGDLVQGNFLDTYHNLTLKGVMGFRWVTRHCARARLVIKLDDDVFFDTLKFIHNYWAFVIGRKRSIFCFVWSKAKVRREGKWEVEDRLFRNMTFYPYRYCNGMAVILTGDVIATLYEAAKFSPVFWVDDVYLFGVLPAIATNITLYNVYNEVGLIGFSGKNGLECMKRGHACSMLAAIAQGELLETMWRMSRALHERRNWRQPFGRT